MKRRIEFPLLRKDLIELSVRPRTYVIRFFYAFVLFAASCTLFFGDMRAHSISSFGHGQALFQQLVQLQLWGICLVLPAIACGTITVEKERNSLSVLTVTLLHPWEIVLQKLFSRLIPMFSFILLSLPLMAIAYSYGGVEQIQLWTSIFALFMVCLLVGAISVMCSAFCRSTSEAFIASYLIILLSSFFVPLVWLPHQMTESNGARILGFFVLIVGSLFLTPVFLCLGRTFLETRADVPPRNVLLEVFRHLDRFFNELNGSFGGVVLVSDSDVLPREHAISWRETRKKTLGTFRYLFRVMVALEVPILFVCQLYNIQMVRGSGGAATEVMLYGLWFIAPVLILIHASTLVSSERSRETLDALLVAPLSGARILREKLGGVRRLILVLLVPFGTLLAFEYFRFVDKAPELLLFSMLTVLIYLPLLAWLGMWIGLKLRSPMRAAAIALGLVAGVTFLPDVIRYTVTDVIGVNIPSGESYALVFSPADVIHSIEGNQHHRGRGVTRVNYEPSSWRLYALHFLLFGSLLLLVRRYCLKHADYYLGRAGP